MTKKKCATSEMSSKKCNRLILKKAKNFTMRGIPNWKCFVLPNVIFSLVPRVSTLPSHFFVCCLFYHFPIFILKSECHRLHSIKKLRNLCKIHFSCLSICSNCHKQQFYFIFTLYVDRDNVVCFHHEILFSFFLHWLHSALVIFFDFELNFFYS